MLWIDTLHRILNTQYGDILAVLIMHKSRKSLQDLELSGEFTRTQPQKLWKFNTVISRGWHTFSLCIITYSFFPQYGITYSLHFSD